MFSKLVGIIFIVLLSLGFSKECPLKSSSNITPLQAFRDFVSLDTVITRDVIYDVRLTPRKFDKSTRTEVLVKADNIFLKGILMKMEVKYSGRDTSFVDVKKAKRVKVINSLYSYYILYEGRYFLLGVSGSYQKDIWNRIEAILNEKEKIIVEVEIFLK